jgi:hypothetical protein
MGRINAHLALIVAPVKITGAEQLYADVDCSRSCSAGAWTILGMLQLGYVGV